jgi:hypothetical protein
MSRPTRKCLNWLISDRSFDESPFPSLPPLYPSSPAGVSRSCLVGPTSHWPSCCLRLTARHDNVLRAQRVRPPLSIPPNYAQLRKPDHIRSMSTRKRVIELPVICASLDLMTMPLQCCPHQHISAGCAANIYTSPSLSRTPLIQTLPQSPPPLHLAETQAEPGQ